MPILQEGFWGTIPPNDVSHHFNRKTDRPWAEPHHLSHKAWISASLFSVQVGCWIKKKGQNRKKQKGYISTSKIE